MEARVPTSDSGLVHSLEIPRIQALHPQKDRAAPARIGFLIKPGILWAAMSAWMTNLIAMSSSSRRATGRLTITFPSRVAGEVVVGKEVEIDGGVPVCLSSCPDSGLGRPVAVLAPLNVETVQNEQLKGQPRLQSIVRSSNERACPELLL